MRGGSLTNLACSHDLHCRSAEHSGERVQDAPSYQDTSAKAQAQTLRWVGFLFLLSGSQRSAWHSDCVQVLGAGSDRWLGQVSKSVALLLSNYFVIPYSWVTSQIYLLYLWHSLLCQISYSSLFNSNRKNE